MTWKKIGIVGVDSAQLIICDPMYIQMQDSISHIDSFQDVGTDLSKQIKFDMGHDGAGVLFNSGLGDGVYEVWANIKKVKAWGKRICEVKIKLI